MVRWGGAPVASMCSARREAQLAAAAAEGRERGLEAEVVKLTQQLEQSLFDPAAPAESS